MPAPLLMASPTPAPPFMPALPAKPVPPAMSTKPAPPPCFVFSLQKRRARTPAPPPSYALWRAKTLAATAKPAAKSEPAAAQSSASVAKQRQPASAPCPTPTPDPAAPPTPTLPPPPTISPPSRPPLPSHSPPSPVSSGFLLHLFLSVLFLSTLISPFHFSLSKHTAASHSSLSSASTLTNTASTHSSHHPQQLGITMTSLNILDKAFKQKFYSDYFNIKHFCAQLYISSTLAFSNAGLILLKIRKLNINLQTLPRDSHFYKYILMMILSMYIKLFYELNYLELPIFLNFYNRFVIFLSTTMTGVSQSVDDAKQLLSIYKCLDFESIGSSHSIWCLILSICTFTVLKLNEKLYFHKKTKGHNKSLKFNNYSIASSLRKLILISLCKIVLAGIIYIALKNPEALGLDHI